MQRVRHVVQRVRHLLQRVVHVVQRVGHVVKRVRHLLQRVGHLVQRVRHVVQRMRRVVQRVEHLSRASCSPSLQLGPAASSRAGAYDSLGVRLGSMGTSPSGKKERAVISTPARRLFATVSGSVGGTKAPTMSQTPTRPSSRRMGE